MVLMRVKNFVKASLPASSQMETRLNEMGGWGRDREMSYAHIRPVKKQFYTINYLPNTD